MHTCFLFSLWQQQQVIFDAGAIEIVVDNPDGGGSFGH